MSSIASALLAVLLLAAVQEEDWGPALRALATADEKGRTEILRGFSTLPLSRLAALHAAAAREDAPVREAAKRHLPHPAWAGVFTGTLGDLQREFRDLYKYDTPTVRGGRRNFLMKFARDPGRPRAEVKAALGTLFTDGDPRDRAFALEAFSFFGVSDPKLLLPLLKDPDPAVAAAAAAALEFTNDPALLPELVELFSRATGADVYSLARSLSFRGAPELTPRLVEIFRNDRNRRYATLTILEKIGDERAEDALIEALADFRKGQAYQLVHALSALGGERSIAALRALRATLPEKDERSAWIPMALLRLRDPALAREILETGSSRLADRKSRLVRLGDRGLAPELLRRLNESGAKVEERRTLLELLGLLGEPDAVPVLLEALKDGRFAEAAAKGLEFLERPETAGPLAEALKQSRFSEPFVRALRGLPLQQAEASLLEILEDPDGHETVMAAAVDLAVRSGSPKLKSKLLELIAGPGELHLPAADLVLALSSLLTPAERPRFEKGRLSKERGVAERCRWALALSGDPAALAEVVEEICRERARSRREDGDLLSRFPKGTPGLLEEVEIVLARTPDWMLGAQFLARHGNKAGRGLLLKAIAVENASIDPRICAALIQIGETRAILAVALRSDSLRIPPEEAEALARSLDERQVAELREEAWARLQIYGQMPARLLALRPDPESIPLFLRLLRNDHLDNDPSHGVSKEVARALALLKAPGVRIDFLRMLRSNSPGKRMLGADCLAILDDRDSVVELGRLLDDCERIDRRSLDGEDGDQRRVCDAAATAIGRLLKLPLSASRPERLNAARSGVASAGRTPK